MVSRVLCDLLGYADFKPHQEECVLSLLRGDDLLAILPTGGGKSAIYQIPAIVFHANANERCCLVVSPLVSLISDQIDSLNRKLCVTPSGDIARAESATGRAVAGRFGGPATPFIFITPERLNTSSDAVGMLNLSLIVVDEAHCISGHGLAFREEYRDLGHLRQMHQLVPICALTATASAAVSRDIVSSLGLRANHSVVRAPIDRHNLRLTVAFRKSLHEDTGDLARHLGQSQGIVYFQTRDDVEKGAVALKLRGVDIAPYHAGISSEERRSVQDRFVAGRLKCISATIAFGMGIDVPGVRCVVHYGLPGALENYLQEIGRAGRDGGPAECVLYWASSDASARFRVGKDNIDPGLASRGLRAMLDFAQTEGCLRQHLARYFEDEDSTSTCKVRGGEPCSKCRDNGERHFVDYGAESRVLLLTVHLVRAGVTKQLDYHCGKPGKTTEELRRRYEGLHFGTGACRPLLFWKMLHERLRGTRHIRSDEYGVCLLTATGRTSLEGDDPIVLPEVIMEDDSRTTKRPFAALERSVATLQSTPSRETCGGDSSDFRLKAALKALRSAEAASKGCPAYVVFSNKVLEGIVLAKPKTESALLGVAGVGPATEAAYGKQILEIVRTQC